jgi:predicted lipoprotein
MYRVGFAPLLRGEPELAQRIDTAFDASIRLTRESKHSLYDSAAETQRRVALERLLEQSRELKRLVGTELPQALDLPLGFNSLDGD